MTGSEEDRLYFDLYYSDAATYFVDAIRCSQTILEATQELISFLVLGTQIGPYLQFLLEVIYRQVTSIQDEYWQGPESGEFRWSLLTILPVYTLAPDKWVQNTYWDAVAARSRLESWGNF